MFRCSYRCAQSTLTLKWAFLVNVVLQLSTEWSSPLEAWTEEHKELATLLAAALSAVTNAPAPPMPDHHSSAGSSGSSQGIPPTAQLAPNRALAVVMGRVLARLSTNSGVLVLCLWLQPPAHLHGIALPSAGTVPTASSPASTYTRHLMSRKNSTRGVRTCTVETVFCLRRRSIGKSVYVSVRRRYAAGLDHGVSADLNHVRYNVMRDGTYSTVANDVHTPSVTPVVMVLPGNARLHPLAIEVCAGDCAMVAQCLG